MPKCHPFIFHRRTPLLPCVAALLIFISAALVLLPLTAAAADAPIVTAASAIVIDADSGAVLYEHHSQDARPIASLTKLFTTWSAVQVAAPGRMMTVEPSDLVGEASMGLVAGERLSFDALLHGMLLASGNDAAAVVGRELGGTAGTAAFVAQMNADAQALGLTATTLMNPHGLDATGHVSTARDVATLALAIHQQRPQIEELLGQTSWTGSGHLLMNTNTLLGNVPGVIAGKTGVTPAAGTCLLEIVERNGRTLIVVTLGSTATSAVDDSMALIDDGFRRLGVETAQIASAAGAGTGAGSTDASAAPTTQEVGGGLNPDVRGSQWLWVGVALVAVAISLSGFCLGSRAPRRRSSARSRPAVQTSARQDTHIPAGAANAAFGMTGPLPTALTTAADVVGFAMTSPVVTTAATSAAHSTRVAEYRVQPSAALHGGSMVPSTPLPVSLLAGTPVAQVNSTRSRQRGVGLPRTAPTTAAQRSASRVPQVAPLPGANSRTRQHAHAHAHAHASTHQSISDTVAGWTRDVPSIALRVPASSGD